MNNKQLEQRYLRWYGKHLGVLFIALERNGTIARVLATILALFNYVVICYIVGIVFAPDIVYADVIYNGGVVINSFMFGFLVSIIALVIFCMTGGILEFFQSDYRETLQEYGRKDK